MEAFLGRKIEIHTIDGRTRVPTDPWITDITPLGVILNHVVFIPFTNIASIVLLKED